MNNDKKYTVYKHTSPEGKIYIGCTHQKPKRRWQHGHGYHHNEELTSDIKKFGWDSFEHEIIYSGSEEEAYSLERKLIHKYDSSNPDRGYNKSIGGKVNKGMIRSDEYRQMLSERTSGKNHPLYGKRLSEEHRQKIRDANMGHTVSEEARIKIGNGNRGKVKSEETIKKWRESRKGYIPSEETRQRMSEAQRDKYVSEETKKKIGDANRGKVRSEETKRKLSETRPNRRKVMCIETGIVYESMRDAANAVGTPHSNIGSVCTGKTKTAGGYTWKYVD